MKTIQAELKNLRHKQQILGILVFSLVTIMVWVGISLITSQTDTSISAELQRMALPLNPSINVEVLSSLEQKTAYNPSQLTAFPIYRLLTDEEAIQARSQSGASGSGSSALQSLTLVVPSPTPTPIPEATDSATASPSATTTPSPSPSVSPSPATP